MHPQLRLASLTDFEQLLPLMQAYYCEDQLDFDPRRQGASLSRLLQEPRWGRVWLIEIERRAVGYLAVCFGFSLELGGNDAYLDELFVIPVMRRKGLARYALQYASTALREMGICAVHLEVDRDNQAAQQVYTALGYQKRDRYFFMSKDLTAGN